jgi:hypothetical protein
VGSILIVIFLVRMQQIAQMRFATDHAEIGRSRMPMARMLLMNSLP